MAQRLPSEEDAEAATRREVLRQGIRMGTGGLRALADQRRREAMMPQRTREEQVGEPLTDRQRAVHALNRMAFGPRPEEIDAVMALGVRAWMERQLEPSAIADPAVEAEVRRRFPSLSMTMQQVLATYRLPTGGAEESQAQREQREAMRRRARQELPESVLYRAVHSERQFAEVMVHFWRNHLNIYQNNDNDLLFLAANYEEQVIRRHAFGRYEDLLIASARHPAMLTYLDNRVSQRPLSPQERQLVARYDERAVVPGQVQRLLRRPGLNENYARELLELHTLGVDRLYRQRDVTEVARVLTGWTVGQEAGAGADYGGGNYGFVFDPARHDPLEKRVLGHTFAAGGGQDDGLTLLRGLARHRATAQLLSYKLCVYLVRDEPSLALVRSVADTFERTGGHLPSVYRAILFSDDFFFRQNHQVKFKTPFEFSVSALRALEPREVRWPAMTAALRQMDQPIYGKQEPNGYDDRAEAWLDPGVLVHRWTVAGRLARGELTGAGLLGGALQGQGPLRRLPVEAAIDWKEARLLPAGMSEATRAILRQEAAAGGTPEHLLGLVLGSPDFMQQ